MCHKTGLLKMKRCRSEQTIVECLWHLQSRLNLKEKLTIAVIYDSLSIIYLWDRQGQTWRHLKIYSVMQWVIININWVSCLSFSVTCDILYIRFYATSHVPNKQFSPILFSPEMSQSVVFIDTIQWHKM